MALACVRRRSLASGKQRHRRIVGRLFDSMSKAFFSPPPYRTPMSSPRRWLWFVLPILIALGLARLRFDVEVLDLLPDDAPAVQGLKICQQHFANARELILYVHTANGETTESAARDIADRLR